MQTLREFQQSFRRALFDPTSTSPALRDQIVTHGLPAERRLNVYRNNMIASLTESLKATYPAVVKIVGDDFFKMLARRYIESSPSTCGDLHTFGDNFDKLVDSLPETRSLPYLADIARLEWGYHIVFHAVEDNPITLDALAEADIEPDQYDSIRFHFHPASMAISSRYPITNIWRFAINEADDDRTLDIDTGGENVLVARRDNEMEFQNMGDAEYRFVQSMISGLSLAECFAAGCEVNTEFDLSNALSQQFLRHNITGFSLCDAPDALSSQQPTNNLSQ
ncbi:MAG: DUF2063 domain-containing protein [marine bacterium B5-7]|nr:MAG: DUF2063 domain-containing protein [marine bacterium B5-7]